MGSSLLAISTVFGLLLAGLLFTLGDEKGALATLAVSLTTGVGWLVSHIFLVNLLALRTLDSNIEEVPPAVGHSPV